MSPDDLAKVLHARDESNRRRWSWFFAKAILYPIVILAVVVAVGIVYARSMN